MKSLYELKLALPYLRSFLVCFSPSSNETMLYVVRDDLSETCWILSFNIASSSYIYIRHGLSLRFTANLVHYSRLLFLTVLWDKWQRRKSKNETTQSKLKIIRTMRKLCNSNNAQNELAWDLDVSSETRSIFWHFSVFSSLKRHFGMAHPEREENFSSRVRKSKAIFHWEISRVIKTTCKELAFLACKSYFFTACSAASVRRLFAPLWIRRWWLCENMPWMMRGKKHREWGEHSVRMKILLFTNIFAASLFAPCLPAMICLFDVIFFRIAAEIIS